MVQTQPTPLAISHRGAHDTLPENSIPAFLRAIELGADGIELDVHATADGTVIVHHDFVVSARGLPAGLSARIEELTAQRIAELSLAKGVGIPTLTETLEAIGDRADVFIEIKAKDIEPLVVRCIRESAANCAVHSFDHRIVVNVKKLFPAIRTGVLEVARHVDPVAALSATGAQDLWQNVDYIDEELVARAHAAGARVIAWTADDAHQWAALRKMGVDGLCTDRIGELAARPQ